MTIYTVRGLKTWNTHEGGGFQCTLLRDGKPVAEVTNEGNGGCFRFYWKSPLRATATVRRIDGSLCQVEAYAEEAKLWAHVLTLPQVEHDGDRFHVDPDMFVEDLVGDLEVERAVKRMLKKPAILFNGQFKVFNKTPLTAELRTHVASNYPGAVILNDLPQADVVAAYKKAQ